MSLAIIGGEIGKKIGVILLIALVFSTVGYVAMNPATIAGEPFDTETTVYIYESASWKVRTNIELSDRYNDGYFSTDWKSHSGQSLAEPIFISDAYIEIMQLEKGLFFDPKIVSPDYSNSCIDYWYEWYVNGEIYRTNPIEEPYHLFDGDIYDGDWDIPFESWQRFPIFVDDCPIIGSETGEIEVVLKANFKLMHQGWAGDDVLEFEGDNSPLSKDGAYLKSGAGTVRATEELVEVGDSVDILVETGNIHGEGWTIKAYPPSYVGSTPEIYDAGNPLDGFSGQDNFRGYVNFDVPLDWWVIGEEDSECRVELFNHLWRESVTTFFTIDNKEFAPMYGEDSNDMIVSVEGDFEVGAKISVVLHAEVNNLTQTPISHFYAYVYYGVPGTMPGFAQDYILDKEKYYADANGDASFSFNIGRDGNVVIRIIAIDDDGRSSEPAYYGITVYPVEDGIPGYAGWVTPEFPFVMTAFCWALLVVSAIISILLGAFLHYGLQVELHWTIIFAIISKLCGAGIIYYVGTHPNMANIASYIVGWFS